jgi:hypothetical protein
VNVCRYITGIENVYLTSVIMRDFKLFGNLLAGGILRMDVPKWTVELAYSTDTKKRSTSEIYVILYPTTVLNWVFSLSHTSRPDKMVMVVTFR